MKENSFEEAPCGIFSFYDDGTLFIANRTFYNQIGYTAEELQDKKVEYFFTIPTRIFHQTHFFPLVKMRGEAEEIFLTLLTKEGNHLPVLLNAKRFEDDRPYTSCAFIVVPNRKKFEDELVSAKKKAEQAVLENAELIKAKAELQNYAEQLNVQSRQTIRQNHELKQFNHVVTHNLKEPLRKILLFAGKIQYRELGGEMKSDVERILRATEQMRNVVTGLQQYVWLSDAVNKFETVDLNEALQRSIYDLKEELACEQLELYSEELPTIEADRAQMKILLYQVLHNAIKFKKGDKVEISVTCTVLKKNRFTGMEKYQYEDFAKLEIRDKGKGFDPKFGDMVFEIFKKLHYGVGQGIGLALCKKIADNHHGTIEVDSKPDEYTALTVWLPMKQQVFAT